MSDVARSLGLTPVAMRRAQYRVNRVIQHGWHDRGFTHTCRDLVAYARLTYAVRLIIQGVKIDAARRKAGFANKTSFNRRTVAFFGYRPNELKGRLDLLPLLARDVRKDQSVGTAREGELAK